MQPRYVIGASENSKFYVFDWDTGREVHQIQMPNDPWQARQISETMMATTGDGNKLRLYTIDTWEQTKEIEGHGGSTRALVYLPESDQIATGSTDDSVKIWDYHEGRCLHTFSEPAGSVVAVDHMPELPNLLFVGSDDDHVRVFDLETQICLHNKAQQDDVDGLDHDVERGILFAGDDHGDVVYYDIRGGFEVLKTLSEPEGSIRTVTVRAEQNQLVVPTYQGKIYVYDLRMDSERLTMIQGHGNGNSLYGSCDVKNGGCFVTSSWDEHIKCWNDDWSNRWDFGGPSDTRGVCVIYQDWVPMGSNSTPRMEAEKLDDDMLKRLLVDPADAPHLKTCIGELTMASGPVRIPRSLLATFPGLDKDTGCVTCDLDLKLPHPMQLLGLLAGDHTRVGPKYWLDYFRLFRDFGLKGHMYLVAKVLSTVEKTSILVDLAIESVKLFEGGTVTAPDDGEAFDPENDDDLLALMEEEEGQEPPKKVSPASPDVLTPSSTFKCGFTLGCVKALHGRVEEITSTPSLAKACRQHHLIGPIATMGDVPLFSHSDFGFQESNAPNSFLGLARAHLRNLLKTMEHTNVTLAVREDDVDDLKSSASLMPPVASIRAHLDVLLLKDSSIASLLDDKAVAKHLAETNELVLKDFPTSKSAMGAVLESIYVGTILVEDFKTLIPLWAYAVESGHDVLSKVVVKKVRELSRKYQKAKTLETEVGQVAHLLTDRLMMVATSVWPSLPRDKLERLRLTSMQRRTAARMEVRFATVEARLDTVQLSMREIQTSLREIMGLLVKEDQ